MSENEENSKCIIMQWCNFQNLRIRFKTKGVVTLFYTMETLKELSKKLCNGEDLQPFYNETVTKIETTKIEKQKETLQAIAKIKVDKSAETYVIGTSYTPLW